MTPRKNKPQANLRLCVHITVPYLLPGQVHAGYLLYTRLRHATFTLPCERYTLEVQKMYHTIITRNVTG